MDVRKHVIFEVQSPRSPDHSPVDFYLWGQIKTLMYSDPIENEGIVHQRIFVTCPTVTTALGLLQGYQSLRSDVSMHTLVQVGNMLHVCCELWLDEQQQLSGC